MGGTLGDGWGVAYGWVGGWGSGWLAGLWVWVACWVIGKRMAAHPSSRAACTPLSYR